MRMTAIARDWRSIARDFCSCQLSWLLCSFAECLCLRVYVLIGSAVRGCMKTKPSRRLHDMSRRVQAERKRQIRDEAGWDNTVETANNQVLHSSHQNWCVSPLASWNCSIQTRVLTCTNELTVSLLCLALLHTLLWLFHSSLIHVTANYIILEVHSGPDCHVFQYRLPNLSHCWCSSTLK